MEERSYDAARRPAQPQGAVSRPSVRRDPVDVEEAGSSTDDLVWDAFAGPLWEGPIPSAPSYTPSNAPTIESPIRLESEVAATSEDVARLGKVLSRAMLARVQRGEVTLGALRRMPGIIPPRTLTKIEERKDEVEGEKGRNQERL